MRLSIVCRRTAPRLYDWLAYQWSWVVAALRLRVNRVPTWMLLDLAANMTGSVEKECPICGYSGPFRAFGAPPRYNAVCPSCGSLERHRLFALVMRKMPLIAPGYSVLHFAPESSVRTLLELPGVYYVSADLADENVDLKLNIEDIDLPDGTVDFVFCSHVLQYVDDRSAFLELYRILKPQGILCVMVPMVACELTYEFEELGVCTHRGIGYGKSDNVRVYGNDFGVRLAAAGFSYETHTAFGSDAVRYGLSMGEKVFVCRKND
jgi:SAM-dependent methyltransferase